jgi:isoquinoline 1-oxidoreductase subunit beta
MSRDASGPSRRDFLSFGVLLGGGLLVSMVLPGCAPPRPNDPTRPKGTFVPNAWLRITPDDRYVFVFDRTEMGQGALTGHAQLVSEELHVAPERLTIEIARADRAYDNPAFHLQVTGGSSSTREAWKPLRVAAATTKAMLVSAAARRFGVAPEACTVDNGVIHGPEASQKLTYGQVAEAAAKEPVPQVELTKPADFRVIGKSVPRLDQGAKVRGKAVFGLDVRLPGLLHAVVLRPPTLGAKLVGYEHDFFATRQRECPGILDVVPIPSGLAVVASRHWQALRGADALGPTVRWSKGHESLDDDALRKAYLARTKDEGHVFRNDGDFAHVYQAAQANPASGKIVEAIYELPFLAHATMEPQNATASVQNGRCEVWAPTQAVGLAVEVVREITGFADDSITIHQTMMGGGFGRRAAQDFVAEAVHLALRLRKPVQIIWSREDDTRHDVYRPMATTLCRGVVGAPGDPQKSHVLGMFQRVVTQSILAQSGPEWTRGILPSRVPLSLGDVIGKATGTLFGGGALPDPTSVEGSHDLAYAIPNQRVEHSAIQIDVPIGFWRSVGYSHNTFVSECFLDELCHAMGKDPVEVRLALLAHKPKERTVLELVAQRVGWKTPPPAGVFRGIAQAKSFGTAVAMVAEIRMEGGFPVVLRVVAAVDCGLVVNPDIVRAAIESSVAFGLGPALKQLITLKRGQIEQGNFDTFEVIRMNEMPKVEIHLVESNEAPQGIGEPGVPCVAPAVANAVFAATGHRVRRLPMTVGLPGIAEVPR